MYIQAILSFLGGWARLEKDHPDIVMDIKTTLKTIDKEIGFWEKLPPPHKNAHPSISPIALNKSFQRVVHELGWDTNNRLPISNTAVPFFEIDAVKNKVGLDLFLGKRAFVESMLFSKFPIFIQSRQVEIAIILVPSKSVSAYLPIGVSLFESIKNVLSSTPIFLKYPFVIIGFSLEDEPIQVIELTSELDNYLIKDFGYRLSEMIIMHEMPFFDFKEKFTGGDRFKETVCAFANLPNGGVFLIGVADDGALPGVPSGKQLDGIKLGIDNTIKKNRFSPQPRYSFHVFDNENKSNTCIFGLRIYESDIRPCTYDGRVYIRSGTSTEIAAPEEIRRIVLR